MSDSVNHAKAVDLIHFFSTISSTEDFIIYVAGTEGMLLFCRNLLEEFDQNPSSENVRQINLVCKSQGILIGLFYSELRKVLLALNTFHDQDRNHYETLGLQSDAGVMEVKKAYRKLSLLYHPDKSEQGKGQADRFMEISGAYHAILINRNNVENIQHAETSWRDVPAGKHQKRSSRKKRFFFGLTVLVGTLILISLYLADRFNDNVLRHHPLNSTASSSRYTTPSEEADEKTAVLKNVLELAQDNSNDQDDPLSGGENVDSEGENIVYQRAPAAMQPAESVIYPISSGRSQAELEAETDSPAQPVPAEEEEIPEQPSMVTGTIHPQISEKQNNKIEAFNREVKISFLLKQYTKLYNRKELDTYLGLFTDAATENGNPLTAEVSKYKKLFAATETIDLRLHDIDWQEQQDGFQATGTFTGNYTYKDGNQQLHKGDIIFQLREEQGTMKIESLVYFFKE